MAEAELDRRVPGYNHDRSRPGHVGGQMNTHLSFILDARSDRFEALLVQVSIGSARMSPDIDLPDDDVRSVVLVEIEHGSGKVFASMYRAFVRDVLPSEGVVEEFAETLRDFLRQHLDVMTSLLETRRSLGAAGTEWVP